MQKTTITFALIKKKSCFAKLVNFNIKAKTIKQKNKAILNN